MAFDTNDWIVEGGRFYQSYENYLPKTTRSACKSEFPNYSCARGYSIECQVIYFLAASSSGRSAAAGLPAISLDPRA